MPGRDGTGPVGAGPTTGRGFGLCTGWDTVTRGAGRGLGLGLACRRGFGRGFAVNKVSLGTQKELLQEQRNLLQNMLEDIDKQLEKL